MTKTSAPCADRRQRELSGPPKQSIPRKFEITFPVILRYTRNYGWIIGWHDDRMGVRHLRSADRFNAVIKYTLVDTHKEHKHKKETIIEKKTRIEEEEEKKKKETSRRTEEKNSIEEENDGKSKKKGKKTYK